MDSMPPQPGIGPLVRSATPERYNSPAEIDANAVTWCYTAACHGSSTPMPAVDYCLVPSPFSSDIAFASDRLIAGVDCLIGSYKEMGADNERVTRDMRHET